MFVTLTLSVYLYMLHVHVTDNLYIIYESRVVEKIKMIVERISTYII